MRKSLMSRPSGLVLASLMAAAALAGCNKNPAAPASTDLASAPPPASALPLSNAAAPPLADAPPVSALPPAPPPRRARLADPNDAYAFSDRADEVNYGLGDAPPDYAFDYQGVRPWAWQGDNGYETVVEPLPGGGDRYYYYDPGSDQPFLVRDPEGAYGYENGALVVVYDPSGRPLPPQYVNQDADYAGRYLWRAQALWDTSRRAQHYGVPRSYWYDRRAQIQRENGAWLQARQQDQGWAAYHAQHAAEEQAQWAPERYRREAEAYRIDQAANDVQAAVRERQAAMRAAQAQQQVRGGAPAAPFAAPQTRQAALPPSRLGPAQLPPQAPPAARFGPGAAPTPYQAQTAGQSQMQ
ncbi:MAG: hypothetical protein ACYC8V_15090, partial [Caulobacteraceae bacterium]